MRIASIGKGKVGEAIGEGWRRAGHDVTKGSREPQGAHDVGIGDAAAGAGVNALAVPWDAVREALGAAGDLSGKVVLDGTSPLAMTEGRLRLAPPTGRSGAEEVAALVPGARVVKTLNQTGAENMADARRYAAPPAMLVAGDDAMSDPRDASGYSETDLISAGFIATPRLAAMIEATRPVAEMDVAEFDAVVVAGGQAPMFTFEQETALQRRFVEFYEAGKVAAALCHGTAILRYARLSDGTPLAGGKTVTGFANVEEVFADNTVRDMQLLPRDRHVMPWRIEDELKALGANYVQAGLWKGFAIRDGNLVTGQQNFSGAETAGAVIRALGE